MFPDYAGLFAVSIAAFILKAMTGFGPTIIVISLGSLFIAPREIVVVASLLDLTAGLVLLKMEWDNSSRRFWIPLAAVIVLGSVAGGMLLNYLPVHLFHAIMSAAILAVGIQFLWGGTSGLVSRLPEKSRIPDQIFSFVGGVCGGLVGIDGPPLIWHFGRKFSKTALRKVLIPVFLAAAAARAATYSTAGLMTPQTLRYAAAALPGLFIGIYLGNRIFLGLSQIQFSRIVGIVLISIGLKHVFF